MSAWSIMNIRMHDAFLSTKNESNMLSTSYSLQSNEQELQTVLLLDTTANPYEKNVLLRFNMQQNKNVLLFYWIQM